MGQDQREKKMAGGCALDMCGSYACAYIRGIDSGKLEPVPGMLYYGEDELPPRAWQLDTSCAQHIGNAQCGFQAACARLEMAVRLSDLDKLAYEIDYGLYRRDERMDICGAWADDTDDEGMALGAGGVCSDYSNECDDTWDCMGDPCVVLWAGAYGLDVCGTGLGQAGIVQLKRQP